MHANAHCDLVMLGVGPTQTLITTQRTMSHHKYDVVVVVVVIMMVVVVVVVEKTMM